MELNWLLAFVALSETMNFSRAAEKRNITQPAFSRRIRALENWVGAALVERTTHSVALTPSGKQFLGHAKAACLSLEQARCEAIELARSDHASLNIAATHALSFTFIPEWLRGQNARITLGPLNLVSDSMLACESLMQKGDADFLIAYSHPSITGHLPESAFQSRVIGHDRLMPMIAPDLLRAHAASGNAPPYLAYSAESGLGRIVARLDQCVSRQSSFTSHLAATLHSMVRSGAGYAWLPESLVLPDIDAGELERFADGGEAIDLEIRITRPRRRLGKTAEDLWAHSA